MMDNKKSASSVAMSEETPASLHAAGQANAKVSADIIHHNGADSQEKRFFSGLQRKAAQGVMQASSPDEWDAITKEWIFGNVAPACETARDNGYTYADGSKHLRALMKSGETGAVVLGDGVREASISFSTKAAITPMEYNVLRSIMAFYKAGQVTAGGNVYFTAGQMYRKIRHGAGSGSLPANRAPQKEIEKTLEQLERRITMSFSEGAFAWIRLDGENVRFEGRTARPNILQYTPIDGAINGKEETLYIINNLPVICAITEQINQGELLPQAYLGIQQHTGNGWRRWNLTEQRINVRTALELWVMQAYRAREAGKPISLKKPYADIMQESRTTDTNKGRALAKSKEAAAVVLDWWKHCGFIADWGVYSTTTEAERGVYIALQSDEEGAAQ